MTIDKPFNRQTHETVLKYFYPPYDNEAMTTFLQTEGFSDIEFSGMAQNQIVERLTADRWVRIRMGNTQGLGPIDDEEYSARFTVILQRPWPEEGL